MNINSYISKFGKFTFSERKFNYVDAVILSQLSYVNFDLVAKGLDEEQNNFELKDIKPQDIKPLASGELTTNENTSLLKRIRISRRFKHIKVAYIQNIISDHKTVQFFALTLLFPNGDGYIALRGTDLNLFGWKEDFNMCLYEEVPSQRLATNYLNKVSKYINGNIYVGGHSKGGNLSFYAAINADKEVQDRIVKAFSFDGQGYFSKELANKIDEKLSPKLVKIVPHNAIVGVALSQIGEYKIVKSTYQGIFQHNPYSWFIDPKNGKFSFMDKRSKSSIITEKTISGWLDSLKDEERLLAINVIFEYLGGSDKDLAYVGKHLPQTIINIVKLTRNFDDDKKKKIKYIVKQLLYYHKSAKEEYKLEVKNLKENK